MTPAAASGTPVVDAGGAAGVASLSYGHLSELGITNSGIPFCINDAANSGAYHQLCLGANSLGGGLIAYNAYGGASPLGLSVMINGIVYPFPGAGNGNVIAPTSPAPTANDQVVWNGTTTVRDGGSLPIVNLTDTAYGGVCDGTTDNHAAFASALSALVTAGGGVLRIPSAGHSCYLATGVTIAGSGIKILGDAAVNFPGLSTSDAETWAQSGSWLKCGDTGNPCITITGTGDAIDGVNFIYTQPTPSGSFTPTTYPYAVEIASTGNGTALRNFSIIAGTHCVDWEGPSSGTGLGIYSYMDNLNLDCFNVGTTFHNVDNTLSLHNIKYDNYWMQTNAAVTTYIESNKVDWDVRYLANVQADGIEFFQSYRSMQFVNSTITNGFGSITFAANEMQLSNISFNEVCQAISIPSGNGTVVTGTMSNVILYGDTGTGCYATAPIMMDLSSDSASLAITNMDVGFVQTLAAIGHGAGGNLHIAGLDVQKYSAASGGANAFEVSANASFTVTPYTNANIRPGSGAGAIIGPGVDSSQGYLGQIQAGGGGVEGYVTVFGSGDLTNTGEIDFFKYDNTRLGHIGRNSTGLQLTAESGSAALVGPGGSSLAVSVSGGMTRVGLGLGGLPLSCSGLTTGDLWMDSGAAFTVKVCP